MKQYRIVRNVHGYWIYCGWYTTTSEDRAIAIAKQEYPNQSEFMLDQTREA